MARRHVRPALLGPPQLAFSLSDILHLIQRCLTGQWTCCTHHAKLMGQSHGSADSGAIFGTVTLIFNVCYLSMISGEGAFGR
ncbi:hypothetical protein BJ912DRAFT_954513 [Pholiota molesta]|nr:hypothetical protein BJ912DRAFT_954513 [Pholiota molesta]